MIYNGVDQNCKPSPDFPDAAIVAKGNKIIGDISLEEAYATGYIGDDVMRRVMECCRGGEYAKLLDEMADDEHSRALDAQLDEYIERRVDEGY